MDGIVSSFGMLLWPVLYVVGGTFLTFVAFRAIDRFFGQTEQASSMSGALTTARTRRDRGEIDDAEYKEIVSTLTR